jgi:hypothetical protein
LFEFLKEFLQRKKERETIEQQTVDNEQQSMTND